MIISVTDRNGSRLPFLEQVELIASGKPDAILLREKDLAEDDFRILAEEVSAICRRHSVKLCINSFHKVASLLEDADVQLPMHLLREHRGELKGLVVWASVHSPEEAVEAVSLGTERLIFGNVYETSCKPGKSAAGTSSLRKICEAVDVPVYGIGGIRPENIADIFKVGAAGACIRSGLMRAEDPASIIAALRASIQG